MKTTLTMAAMAAALVTSTLACKQEAPATQPAQKAGIKVSPTQGGAEAAAQAAGAMGQPAAHGAPGAPGGVSGKILETMDSGGYTYIKLQTPDGEKWAAVRQTVVKVGDEATIASAMVMKGFHSKTLDRTFDEILFGELGSAGGPPAGPHGGMAAGPHGGMAAAPAEGAPAAAPAEIPGHAAPAVGGPEPIAEPIARAESAEGHTVAEVFEKKADLAGKPVAIRGKVTKYNSGIMGKNWLHLQDGSGAPEAKNFDLTVTSADEATVGDVVIIRGTVAVDKDFGAGYAYDVIVEDATVTK